MQVEIYHAYIGELSTDTFLRVWNALPNNRRQQLSKRTESARRESACLSALLGYALPLFKESEGVCFRTAPSLSAAAVYPHWICSEKGQPFPQGITVNGRRLFVGFSHSEGHLLAALSDRPIGADIQIVNASFEGDRLARLAKRICHETDLCPTTAQEGARLFAAKEAVLKLRGVGLAGGMHKVAIRDSKAEGCSLFFEELSAENGRFAIAVAVDDQPT